MSRSSLAALLLGVTLLAGCEGPQAPPVVQIPPPPMPEPRKLNLVTPTSTRPDVEVGSVNVNIPAISPPTAAQIAILQSGTDLEGKEKVELSGPLANGKKLDWDSYRGKVVLVMEWASWCQHCRTAMDQLEGISKNFEGRPFTVLGLNIDVETKAAISFLDARKPAFDNIIDSKQKMAMVKKFPVKAVPTYIFVNKAGRRVELELSDPNVWGKIDVLLQEPFDPDNPDAKGTDVAEPVEEETPVDVFADEKKEAEKPLGKPLRERIRDANGQEFLDLHGPTYNGETFDWASYRGRAVIVVFWASWCPHCKELLTKLENVRRVAHSYNVDIVGVNVDRTPEQAISFLDVAELPFENILDGKQEMELDREYPTTTLPVIVAVNKTGKIVPFDFAAPGVEKKLVELCQEPYTGPLSPKSPSSTLPKSEEKVSKKASSNSKTTTGKLVEAKAGVGKKGQGYGGGIYTEPLKARWTTEQKLIFDVQIPKAMSLYQATHDQFPASHEEFMKEIIEENSIELPELPPGEEYVYLPEKGKLMVRQPKK